MDDLPVGESPVWTPQRVCRVRHVLPQSQHIGSRSAGDDGCDDDGGDAGGVLAVVAILPVTVVAAVVACLRGGSGCAPVQIHGGSAVADAAGDDVAIRAVALARLALAFAGGVACDGCRNARAAERRIWICRHRAAARRVRFQFRYHAAYSAVAAGTIPFASAAAAGAGI